MNASLNCPASSVPLPVPSIFLTNLIPIFCSLVYSFTEIHYQYITECSRNLNQCPGWVYQYSFLAQLMLYLHLQSYVSEVFLGCFLLSFSVYPQIPVIYMPRLALCAMKFQSISTNLIQKPTNLLPLRKRKQLSLWKIICHFQVICTHTLC